MHTSALKQQREFPHARSEGGKGTITEQKMKQQSFGEY